MLLKTAANEELEVDPRDIVRVTASGVTVIRTLTGNGQHTVQLSDESAAALREIVVPRERLTDRLQSGVPLVFEDQQPAIGGEGGHDAAAAYIRRIGPRERLMAAALDLLADQAIAAGASWPVPGTDPQRYVIIGKATEVLDLLPEITTVAGASIGHDQDFHKLLQGHYYAAEFLKELIPFIDLWALRRIGAAFRVWEADGSATLKAIESARAQLESETEKLARERS